MVSRLSYVLEVVLVMFVHNELTNRGIRLKGFNTNARWYSGQNPVWKNN